MKGSAFIAGVGLALALCGSGGAWAAMEPPDPTDEMMGRFNLQPAFEKGGRGLSNLCFGFLEVPLNIHKRRVKADVIGSWFTGTLVGLFKGAVRTGVGLYETVTFFLPYPEDFKPILPTIEYSRQDLDRDPLPFER